MDREVFLLRSIELGDLEGANRLSDEAGWNQTEKDWKFLIESPEHVSVLVESDSEVIGTATATIYSSRLAWIGMVLVDKNFRRRGAAKAMLQYLFNKIRCSIKLDATPEGERVYRNLGFHSEYTIVRMTVTSLKEISASGNSDCTIEPLKQNSIEEITDFDSYCFGVERKSLLNWLVKEFPQKAWMAKRNNRLVGFVLGRDGKNYQYIGPLMAKNGGVAQQLLTTVLKELVGLPVVVDVCYRHTKLIDWLNSIGFERQRDFIRMYRDENKYQGYSVYQYLIAGPEFG